MPTRLPLLFNIKKKNAVWLVYTRKKKIEKLLPPSVTSHHITSPGLSRSESLGEKKTHMLRRRRRRKSHWRMVCKVLWYQNSSSFFYLKKCPVDARSGEAELREPQ